MANNTKFKSKLGLSSSLNNLLLLCSNKEDKDLAGIEIRLANGFEDYTLETLDNLRLHEAGYDAYITGLVYAKMFYSLEQKEKTKVSNAVNIMKSLYYFKHGLLNEEEPMFKEVAIIL